MSMESSGRLPKRIADSSFLRNLRPYVLFLESNALNSAGCALTTLSPRGSFIGKKFSLNVGPSRKVAVFVVSFLSPAAKNFSEGKSKASLGILRLLAWCLFLTFNLLDLGKADLWVRRVRSNEKK